MTGLAFTTRLPLAVMIAMGIKQWENRSAMPTPPRGVCGMTVSKSSSAAEYANFIGWANRVFPEEAFSALPLWEQVSGWRGKLIAVCNYDASNTPGPPVWNEGYPVWWYLTNVRLLKEPIPCRGNVGMWELPDSLLQTLSALENQNMNYLAPAIYEDGTRLDCIVKTTLDKIAAESKLLQYQ